MAVCTSDFGKYITQTHMKMLKEKFDILGSVVSALPQAGVSLALRRTTTVCILFVSSVFISVPSAF